MAEFAAESARLRLRQPDMHDLDWWLEEMNVPAVTRHLGGVLDRAAVEAKIGRTIAGFASEGFGFWIIELRDSNRAIGNCGMARIDGAAASAPLQGEVHVGWSLAEAYWGMGYACEAASMALDLAFGRFGMTQVYSQTSEANVASWRLMRKLGMERVAELDYVDPEYPPEENPTIIYCIDVDRWRSRIVDKLA